MTSNPSNLEPMGRTHETENMMPVMLTAGSKRIATPVVVSGFARLVALAAFAAPVSVLAQDMRVLDEYAKYITSPEAAGRLFGGVSLCFFAPSSVENVASFANDGGWDVTGDPIMMWMDQGSSHIAVTGDGLYCVVEDSELPFNAGVLAIRKVFEGAHAGGYFSEQTDEGCFVFASDKNEWEIYVDSLDETCGTSGLAGVEATVEFFP